jgi:hypothetical protein
VFLLFYDSGATNNLSIVRNAVSGCLEIRRGGPTGTLLDTGTTVIGLGNTYLIEVRYKPLNAGGVVEVKVDGGAVEADYSGDTTAGIENVTSVLFWSTTGQGGWWIDDVRIDDAAWIGDSRIQGIVPTGPSESGGATDWDPNSVVENWTCVDEKPASDTNYVSTNVSNEVDVYAAGNLTGVISEIKCVQVSARAAKSGAPTPTQLQLLVRPVATDRVSSSKALPTSFGVSVYHIWETNPEDSEAWETADVDGMEIGIKAVA